MQRKKENGPECELSEKAGDSRGQAASGAQAGRHLGSEEGRFSLEKDWNGKGGRRFAKMIAEGQDI